MTLKTTQLRDAIVFALAVGTTAAAGVGVASAQERASQEATTLDRIEVTGSRIRQVDHRNRAAGAARSPATTSRSRASARSPTSCRTSPQSVRRPSAAPRRCRRAKPSAASTSTCVTSVPNRTLILVNGKRLGITNDGLQDVASIPAVDGRAHRSAEGRRLVDLRFRRHRRRGEHHHPLELRRRRSQCLLRPVRRRRRHAPGVRLHHRLHRRPRFAHRRRGVLEGRSGLGT